MVLETNLHLCFWWKNAFHFYLALSASLSVIPFLSPLSLHIIMSGRHISTMAIVGPSVYLLTRKDSLCYNRLISLPPRTLISSQLRIETIIAVGGGGTVFRTVVSWPHSTPTPNIRVTLAGAVSKALTLKDDKRSSRTVLLSSLPSSVLSLYERQRASDVCLNLCLFMCA